MKIIVDFALYMKKSFPQVGLRHMHMTLALLVIFQIVNSNFLHMTHAGQLKEYPFANIFLWLHIIVGLMTLVMTIALVIYILKKQSFRQFYPYLFSDNRILIDDIRILLNGKLPDPREKGLANVVQGLGIGALVLIELFALIWLALWLMDSSYANDAREVHKSLTGLIEAYLIAHAGMAFVHFLIQRKKGSL